MVTAILKKTSITALAVIFVLACPSGESSAAKEIPIAGADTEISTHSLHGAYRNAGADTPLILIVPGSGPISRDGNMPGMAGDIYKHLAGQLAAVGISTVRVDKRGMYSSHAAGDPNRVHA